MPSVLRLLSLLAGCMSARLRALAKVAYDILGRPQEDLPRFCLYSTPRTPIGRGHDKKGSITVMVGLPRTPIGRGHDACRRKGRYARRMRMLHNRRKK